MAQYQRQAQVLLPELEEAGYDLLLQHQQDHYEALDNAQIVINTNQTGTGKTLAALLHLLRAPMRDAQKGNTLIVASSNKCIDKLANEVQEFVNTNGLPHIVIRLYNHVIEAIAESNNWLLSSAIYYLLENPYNPKIAGGLSEMIGSEQGQPVCIISNPNIFYYALQANQEPIKKSPLSVLCGQFRYLIVDEFSYYTPKQTAAYFFYVGLLVRYGFFQEGGQLSVLAGGVTPEVAFLNNFKSKKLKIRSISAQRVKASNPDASMSQTPINLEFVVSDRGIQEIVKQREDEIRAALLTGRDVAIISRGLTDISASTRLFSKDEYQTINPATSAKLRTEPIDGLMFATTKAVIGHKFSQPNKPHQALDDIYFTATHIEDFIDCLNYVGQVLGKKDQTIVSNAICVVKGGVYEKLESLNLASKKLTGFSLIQTLSDKAILPARTMFEPYVLTEGFWEIVYIVKRVFGEEIIAALYQSFIEIFSPQIMSWSDLQCRLQRYEKLANEWEHIKSRSPEFPTKLLREFACELAKHKKDNNQTAAELESQAESFYESDIEILRRTIISNRNLLKQYEKYVLYEYQAIQGIFAFNDTFTNISAIVYDKIGMFHPQEKVAKSNIFELIRHYKLYFYPGKKQFLNDVFKNLTTAERNGLIGVESDFYVRLDSPLAYPDKYRLQFYLEVENLRNFERFDTDRVRIFEGVQPTFIISDGSQKRMLPLEPSLIKLISEKQIPMLILSNKTYLRVYNQIQNLGIWPITIKVFDSNTQVTKEFDAIVGLSSYHVARLGLGLHSSLDHYQHFYASSAERESS